MASSDGALITEIVNRLDEPPFNKRLRLVDFHDLSRAELLELFGEVLHVIDPKQPVGDALRDEGADVMATRVLGFLRMARFPQLPPPGTDACDVVAVSLSDGDPETVYPVLHWLLQRIPQLQKRAYLARFLMPVDIPVEFSQDPALMDLLTAYRDLQAEFKGLHKSVDSLRSSDLRPSELKSEMSQLEEERNQLREKIARLKRNAASEPGFDEMLEVTTRLRVAQEEESRLVSKTNQQRELLVIMQQRLKEGNGKLQQLQSSTTGVGSAEAVLLQLRKEVDSLSRRTELELPREIAARLKILRKLQRLQSEPHRSQEDLEELHSILSSLKREVESAQMAADRAFSVKGDSNLIMFRQQATLAGKKLEERVSKLEAMAEEREGLAEEAEVLAAAAEASMKMAGDGGHGAGGGIMSREELKAYGQRLRAKALVYKRLKSELASLRAESVLLGRTEQILRSRDDRLEDFLSDLEEKRGVGGYRQAQAELVERSEAAAAADTGKASMLQEISDLVNAITRELQGRKADLQQQVAELKRCRAEASEVQARHEAAKVKYETMAVGYEVERQNLESECSKLQDAALAEESQFYRLTSLNSILEAQIARVEREISWRRGEGRLLPDFRCFEDLYEHKLRQQEMLSKQLRRQQKSIREKEGGNTVQRKLFDDLHALLHGKMAVRKSLVAVGLGDDEEGLGEALLKGIGDAEYGGGGANVLTL